uniref:IgGFc_binding domain-containing protein n=1 Tax=Rhabditophanes sp. KR3021 TaxID=114890 RepID=A0AC35TR02_9BILA
MLPLSQKESISVNGALFSNDTIQYDTAIGQNQSYVTVGPIDVNSDNSNATIVITATSPLILSYASWWTTTSNLEDDSCGLSCNVNYVTFMPVVSKQCNDLLFPPDQRMITNDFTTRLYASPPSVDQDCVE